MAFEPQIGVPDPNAASMPVRLVGITDNNGNLPTIPDRPSSKTGRTSKCIVADNQTTGQTLYTVTAGKTLYILSVSLSAYNTGTAGRLRIKDNTDVKLPLQAIATGLTALATATPILGLTFIFPEPISFTNSVVTDIPSGTITYSIVLCGYEE